MDFVQAIKSCLGQYATFSGRATRSEFWWFFLFIKPFFIFCILLARTRFEQSSRSLASLAP